jgi:hypothetical protein
MNATKNNTVTAALKIWQRAAWKAIPLLSCVLEEIAIYVEVQVVLNTLKEKLLNLNSSTYILLR